MTASRNVDYYDELADQYSLFFRDPEADMEREGAWLDRVLHSVGARTVLDASCGAGRQSIPLARRGYAVTGADPSEAMLAEARRSASDAGVQLSLRRAAFADLLPALGGTAYDAVIALGNGLCNQELREQVLQSLTVLCSCCREGGICLVGIKDFDAIKRDRTRFHAHRILDDGEERRLLFEVWDFEDPILVCGAFSLQSADGEWSVRRAETREYMLCSGELRALAARAGFTSVERLDHPCEAVYLLRTSSGRQVRAASREPA